MKHKFKIEGEIAVCMKCGELIRRSPSVHGCLKGKLDAVKKGSGEYKCEKYTFECDSHVGYVNHMNAPKKLQLKSRFVDRVLISDQRRVEQDNVEEVEQVSQI